MTTKLWHGSSKPCGSPFGHLKEHPVREYLGISAYRKRVSPDSISPVKLEDVITEVAFPRSSCCGPNGVSFVTYSLLCDIVAPILHQVILYLMTGNAPTDSFNSCNMFFLPKDGSHKPNRTRPIAASNCDNRIVANVIRRKLEAMLLPLICDNQCGFVRGKSIEENIQFFNKRFYNALYTQYSPDYPAPDVWYPAGW